MTDNEDHIYPESSHTQDSNPTMGQTVLLSRPEEQEESQEARSQDFQPVTESTEPHREVPGAGADTGHYSYPSYGSSPNGAWNGNPYQCPNTWNQNTYSGYTPPRPPYPPQQMNRAAWSGYQYKAPRKPAAPVKPKNPEKARKNWIIGVCSGLAAVALVLAAVGITASVQGRYYRRQFSMFKESMDKRISILESMPHTPQGGTPAAPVLPAPVEGALTPGQVYDRNAASVVSIVCDLTSGFGGDLFAMQSSGSGFILSTDGYVATNCHVVEGADKISVKIQSGTVYEAELIGKDASNDIALLKVDAQDLQPVSLGSSTRLVVGDQVVAIGHPLGNQNAILTVGYVSAKDQAVDTDGASLNMLQTDAAINSGNSGGPLFNAFGEVVGITTAKYSGYTESGASIEGVGYAIPVDDIVFMLEDLKQYGHVNSGYLGVYVRDVDSGVQEYGLPAGAFVEDTVEDMAADKAGIQKKDVITDVEGNPIRSSTDLSRSLRRFKPGDTVNITIWRSGEEMIISAVLGDRPAEQEETKKPDSEKPDHNNQPQKPDDGDLEDFFGSIWPFIDAFRK